jgi:two-component system sensor histidine kinase PilS (NtrC family)
MIRLGVGLVLLGGSIAVLGGAPSASDALFRLVLGVFASSLGAAVWLGIRPRDVERIAIGSILVDLLLTSALVYLTGGALSGFSFLYGVAVLGASVVVGPRTTLVIAAATPILYVCVALGLASGVLPGPAAPVIASTPTTDADFSLALLRNIVGLTLVGGLAALLSDRLHQTRGALVRATESAATNARLTEDIVRSLGSGLLTADGRDVVQTINEAGARMFGRSADAIVGQPVDALFVDAARAPETRGEGTARRGDGTTFPVGYSRTALVSHDGEVRGSLLLFQDLTELATLRDKAERAERLAVLGQLAAGLAHEIRNPLGAISGSVELVRDAEALGAEDKRLLETVLGEVDRVNELVSTMLELGRPTAPERRSVDLADVAREVVELARRQPSTASVRVTLRASPSPAVVDPAQLRQVLWNLVKNALQFSPKDGEVTVVVRTEDGRAILEVIDHGRGIDPGDAAHVFDPFFTKRKHGVGLGLAIAKQIVEAHGGTISVTSAGGTTCFVVSVAAA